MGFKESLKDALKAKLSHEELSLLPRGFQTLGTAMILKLNQQLLSKKAVIGEACLEILPSMKSVFLNQGKIQGTFRTPEKIEYIAGIDDPIIEHKENNVIYRFDLTKIMFSKGNVNEKKHLASIVKKGEIIVDMFAGIGYFSLPIAKLSSVEKIYSIELNPLAYGFLVENIRLNHLEDKIAPMLGDSKDLVITLSSSGIKADRVIMGVFPAPISFIKDALTLAKKTGTIYHYEGVEEKEEYRKLYVEFEKIAKVEGYMCKLMSFRYVKSFGPNLYHIVVDIEVLKS
ncbi:MAG: class I SAM-dependent methyltransferase family protein [Promethearchaeota archaeon]|nr:MAG: class I SAM-dependent methyltransferase family protein [Candidatus Lokiarchaeota archaeon]